MLRQFSAAMVGLCLAVSSPAWAGGAGEGSFSGLSNHVAKGDVSLVETDSGWEIRLQDSFWFDGAPDPRVGFGKDGKFVAATDFEQLRENAGAQVYKVPGHLDPADFNEVFIWCRKFSVPLGKARID